MRTSTLLLVLLLLPACREKGDDSAEPVDSDTSPVDADGDGFNVQADCNDGDASVHPDAEEVCDGIDNDCDGSTDGEDATDADTWYADADADGYGDAHTTVSACSQPVEHVSNDSDCDDSDPRFHPGAAESDCTDPADYNCDGSVGHADGDGDGFAACEDCDDDDASIAEASVEVCDGLDNDCDGDIDGESAVDASTWYLDSDGDGYGSNTLTATACDQPSAFVDNDEDCDDLDAAANPGASEVCDGVDNDCDGDIDSDDGSVQGTSTFYGDADGDGYGGTQFQAEACDAPPGFVTNADDCDDVDSSSYPGAAEACDDADNDCDGDIDEGVGSTWYADADSDGYGNGSVSSAACDAPSGFVDNSLDCDDFNATTNPGSYEVCDGADNDCDGSTDEDAINATSWYVDSDGDGYGSSTSTTTACDQPSGHSANDADCNDADGTVSPAATETCDSVDNDCDGATDESDASDASTWYADSDSDGYGNSASGVSACSQPSGHVAQGTDCNDTSSAAYPGATEVCDSLDNDCDTLTDEDDASDAATWYLDADNDAYGDAANATVACEQPNGYVADATDCNDSSSSANPGVSETCDGIDNNCDTQVDEGLLGQQLQCPGTSCLAILNASPGAPADGSYYIDPDGTGAQAAWCDMTDDGGGWTLGMRRAGAEWQEEWMVNTWGSGSLPNQSNTADTSWKVPDAATRIRFAFTSNGTDTPTDYIITSAPGDAAGNTGMWSTSPGFGDFGVTLYTNSVQGLNSTSITWNFRPGSSSNYDYACYGVSSGLSYTSQCDNATQLFGAIYDGCPNTNNSEVYIGTRKDIAGSGSGGAYCQQEDANARWWVWWRDD